MDSPQFKSNDLLMVDEIYLAALEIPGSEDRGKYLAAACAGNDELRRRVERLLAAWSNMGSFLNSPAPEIGVTIDQILPAQLGTLIGPYKLLEQIGEGGMGSVWMAEQLEPVRRRVALKLIKPGMDSRQVIARFAAERQALSMMDHPNIAKVLDAGTTEGGRPYFVMELVKGQPITQYCDEHHLNTEERLELFLTVCHAIQHAHQKGIIHRDIKPSNVMVAEYDGKPVTKVIDFGVAKAVHQPLTDKTMFTGMGQIIGTFEYMSPEQARVNQLDIDTRSDVYSLGVLLYELLTGSTPFDRKRLREAALDELLRIIREEEPPRPSTKLNSSQTLPSIAANRRIEPGRLSTLVRGELDWIVMKALEKDRNRRYETANGFALDVQRYLSDDAVLACPPSPGYRVRKFVRRYRGPLVVTSLAVFLLMVLAISSTIAAGKFSELATRNAELAAAKERAFRQATVSEKQAILARDQEQGLRLEAMVQRDRANVNAARARRAVDQYLSKVTEHELLSVPGLQPLRVDLLTAALGFYAELSEEQGDDRSLQKELAVAQLRRGQVCSELGDGKLAMEAFEEALLQLLELREQSPDDEVLTLLAQAYFEVGRFTEAIETCRQVVPGSANSVVAQRTLASAYGILANQKVDRNELAAGLDDHRQAFDIRQGLLAQSPQDAKYNAELAATLNDIGVVLSMQKKYRESLAIDQQASFHIDTACRLAPQGIQWGQWQVTIHGNVGLMHIQLGELPAALKAYEQQVAAAQRLVTQNSAIPYLRADYYKALIRLAKLQDQLGMRTESNRTRRDALALLPSADGATAEQLFEAATIHAALAAPVDNRSRLTGDDESADESQRQADLAIQTLRAAVTAGWADEEVVANHPALEPLRRREDFLDLVSSVQAMVAARRIATDLQPVAASELANQQNVASRLRALVDESPQNSQHQQQLLAAVSRSLGSIQTELKLFDEAEISLRQALSLSQQWRDVSRDSTASKEVLLAQTALGKLSWERRLLPEAHRYWQAALAELEQLTLANPNEAGVKSLAAEIERQIGDHYGRMGLWPLAIVYAERNARHNRVEAPTTDARFASLLLMNQTRESPPLYFEQLLAKLRQAPASVEEAWQQGQLLWTCGLLDTTAVDVTELLRAMDVVRMQVKENDWLAYTHALILFRAGKLEEATEKLAKLDAMDATWPILMQSELQRQAYSESNDWRHVGMVGQYLHALLLAQVGDEHSARRRLEIADRTYRAAFVRALSREALPLPDELPRVFGPDWWFTAHAQLLRSQVIRKLTGQPAPPDAWQHLLQADGYRQLGELALADRELEAAVAAAPIDAELWLTQVHMFERWGELERAEAAAEKVIQLAPSPQALLHLVAWRRARGERLLADEQFAQILPQLPGFAQAPFSAETAAARQRECSETLGIPVQFTNTVGGAFRLIPPGEFSMGIPEAENQDILKNASVLASELGPLKSNPPPHPVIISQPFYLGACEVTNGEFRQFVTETGYRTVAEQNGLGGWSAATAGWIRLQEHVWSSPGPWQVDDKAPVVHVSWEDAEAFCAWLSVREGRRYRLPTEAQWEFACRAGTTEATYAAGGCQLSDLAWHGQAGTGPPHPQIVGQKMANAFGIHDMLGNVWEVCADGYRSDIALPRGPRVDPRANSWRNGRVVRGGAWYRQGYPWCHAGVRNGQWVSITDAGFGFRVAIDLTQKGDGGRLGGG